MPRGDKSGNTGAKPHRARKIAESLRNRGATRAAANTIATGAMDREGAATKARKPRASAGATARKAGAKQSDIGKRPPRPVSAAGRSAAKKK